MNEIINPGRKPARVPRLAEPIVPAPPRAARLWIGFGELHREPFRLFFPGATLAGLIGVSAR